MNIMQQALLKAGLVDQKQIEKSDFEEQVRISNEIIDEVITEEEIERYGAPRPRTEIHPRIGLPTNPTPTQSRNLLTFLTMLGMMSESK